MLVKCIVVARVCVCINVGLICRSFSPTVNIVNIVLTDSEFRFLNGNVEVHSFCHSRDSQSTIVMHTTRRAFIPLSFHSRESTKMTVNKLSLATELEFR